MWDFSQSTQAKWIFTPMELQSHKESRQADWSRHRAASSNNSSGGPQHEQLTVDEEDLVLDVLIQLYPPEANKAWQFSARVWHVAITFLRRFFLDRSVMDYDVKQCLNTCVVLASKVEEERKNNNRTLQFMQREMANAVDVNSILQLVYVILDALQFQLEIYTPVPSLTGFCLDLQAKLGAYELDLELLGRIKAHAEELVNKAVLTEVCIFSSFFSSFSSLASVLTARRFCCFLRPKSHWPPYAWRLWSKSKPRRSGTSTRC
jgi:hypothetical protein